MRKRPDVLEWVAKAEQDYQTAEVMARKRKNPVPDVVGFHCQQCIEKYLKALLVLKKLDFPKTHDLIELLEIALKKEPLLEIYRPDLLLCDDLPVRGYVVDGRGNLLRGFTNTQRSSRRRARRLPTWRSPTCHFSCRNCW